MKINQSYFVSTRLEAWRNGVFFKMLDAEEMQVQMNEDAEVKTALSCRVRYDAELDLLRDQLRPYQVVNKVEYPMGVFWVSTATAQQGYGGRGLEIEAYDAAFLVRQMTAVASPRLLAGTGYLDAIKRLLAECGVTRVIAEPCAMALEADREDWEVGTDYLSIINSLLAAINYGTLWFDREGAARLQREPAAVAKNLTQIYLPGEWSLLCDGITRETDGFSAHNVFTAVYSAPDAAPMVAVSVNDSPLSPISTVRRGRKICAPAVFVKEIASKEALQNYADRLRAASLLAAETIRFETAPVPTHWIGDVVAIGEGIYQETGWTLRLGPNGSYQHTARRSMI